VILHKDAATSCKLYMIRTVLTDVLANLVYYVVDEAEKINTRSERMSLSSCTSSIASATSYSITQIVSLMNND